jgi:glycerophosphoryl diester phosphodiesterase
MPRFAEQTLPAFAHAWGAERVASEFDVRVTADGVPVVVHDVTLERVARLRRRVDEIDLATFRALRADVLGAGVRLARAEQRVPLATLDDVLRFARATAAPLNVELKRLPDEPGFDHSPAFAECVADALLASGLPPAQLTVQSFWEGHLAVLAERLPGVRRSLLASTRHAADAVERAGALGCDAVGLEWPADPALVESAHADGLRVLAFTLNAAGDIRAAARAGVDVIVTDDPAAARLALWTAGVRADAPPVAAR